MILHIRTPIALACASILTYTAVVAGAHPCGTAPSRPVVSALVRVGLNPQPEPPGAAPHLGLNPQPEPPGAALEPRP